jgi:hypothetical protein
VSNSSRAKKLFSTLWPTAAIAGVLMLLLATPADAVEDTIGIISCVGAPGTVNCVLRVAPAGNPYVRLVPQPENEADKARAAERDHKWLQRCRPVVAQDRYGVPRYHYAALGCDLGVIE